MSMYKRPELDLVNPPGQIVNDITLGDYITRKQKSAAFEEVSQEKKITWGDWYWDYVNKNPDFAHQLTAEIVVALQQCWLTAQENK